MRLFAGFGDREGHHITFLLPLRHLLEEPVAGLLLDLQTFMGDERVVGITSVVGEALGVPSLLVPGPIEEGRGFVEIAHTDRGGTAGKQGFEG